jgi:hypothetical protein
MSIERIKKETAKRREEAEEILNGGDNYDGADGARIVIELCGDIEELLDELKSATK